MVNKREKVYVIISISDKRLSSFFYPFPITLFFFSPYLFRLILLYLNGTCNFFFAGISGRTFFPLLDVSERKFFQVGGGGCTWHPVHPLRTRQLIYLRTHLFTELLTHSLTHSLTYSFFPYLWTRWLSTFY